TQEEILSTLANRLIRLDKQINETEKTNFAEQANGHTINHVVKELLNAYDPDTIANMQLAISKNMPDVSPAELHSQFTIHHSKLIEDAVHVFNNPELRNYIVDVRKKYDQTIDSINLDEVTNIGWVKDQEKAAELTISNFTAWIEAHKDEITALQIFYDQPFRRRELTYKMIKDLYEKIKTEQPLIAPSHVWRAYEQLKEANGSAKNELIALVSLIRRVSGIDETLTGYDKTVDRNFQAWVFKKQAGTTTKFNEEQMQWLRMIKEYVANSFHVEKEDFELDPFNKNGGLGKMWQLFGEQTDEIINELNEVLAA
ncbi:MAG: type I restriction-modification enzyme R subunit C-terminal domain-containing protein, partial [Chitinophagaceae bacterium]